LNLITVFLAQCRRIQWPCVMSEVPNDVLQGIGQHLVFTELQRLVQTIAPAVKLCLDSPDSPSDVEATSGANSPWQAGKGRYIVASRGITVGEVVLAERPIFAGTPEGTWSAHAYTDEFCELANADPEETDLDFDEDCLHPCSPLVDCVAGYVLAKREATSGKDSGARARAALRVRQFWSLSRSATQSAIPPEIAEEIYGVLKPELQASVSVDELRALLQTLSCNRFGSAEAGLDLMFAGSMFEHSCDPNVFLGVWGQALTRKGKADPSMRTYRALRDIPQGEALSIDYLLLPDGYLAAQDRADILGRWSFACGCPRCTSLPDLTRAFVCARCKAPDLCPVSPALVPDKNDSGDLRSSCSRPALVCRSCGSEASPEYSTKCWEHEAAWREKGGGAWFGYGATAEDDAESDSVDKKSAPLGLEGDDILSPFHYAVFGLAWDQLRLGPGILDLEDYELAVEAVVACMKRLYGYGMHPQMLELYHTMAELKAGDLNAQSSFLQLEHDLIERNYPEESERQDAEVVRLLQGPTGDPDSTLDEYGTAPFFGAADTAAPFDPAAATPAALPPAALANGKTEKATEGAEALDDMD